MKTVVALAGNPNVGKSTIFNALTGMKQHTGNWPGKTVGCARGSSVWNNRRFEWVDLPGCYSLAAHSEEEEIARDFICREKPEAVLAVCDASCLERNLNLTLQILELTSRVIVCVNFMDEARQKNIRIDLNLLSEILGVPVIGLCARKKQGFSELLSHLEKLSKSEEPEKKGQAKELQGIRKKLENAGYQQEKIQELTTKLLVKKAEQICEKTVFYPVSFRRKKDRLLDGLFTGRYTGFPVMLLFLTGIFWLTISGANIPSSYLSGFFSWLEARLLYGAEQIGIPAAVYEPLILGMYRVTSWVAAVMLPPMAIFFPLFTILEDFGYLPRIAFNLDRCFQKCRACGKQALTMCMGFGCNAVGVTGCRIIDSKRERLLAILTNSLVPCNGRFPTMLAVLTMFFAGTKSSFFTAVCLAGLLILGVALTFLVSFFLSKTLLRGMPSSFALELPPYRRPQIAKVIVSSVCSRTVFVLGRAVTAAAPAGLLIWFMGNVKVQGASLLFWGTSFLDPFARLLGMDGAIFMSFLLGLPANEIVMPVLIMTYLSGESLTQLSDLHILKTLLTDHGWTWITAVNVLLFSLVHWPCATTCLTIKKETGSLRWVAAAVLIPTALGCALCFGFTRAALWITGRI